MSDRPGPGGSKAAVFPVSPPAPIPPVSLNVAENAIGCATEAQRRLIGKEELLFQAKVSRASADAYDTIVKILYPENEGRG